MKQSGVPTQLLKESTLMNSSNNLSKIADYYSEKIKAHGPIPLGVDWNGEHSQKIRFTELSRIINRENFSISDIGCGYGALSKFLEEKFPSFSYFGYDISPEMIGAAKKLHGKEGRQFYPLMVPIEKTDYVIASGIFNVKLDMDTLSWEAHIERTIELFNTYSSNGFAFNCLTSYSDPHKMQSHLHYCQPEHLFTLCKSKFSKNVSLLHDYSLYEFTILVRK